MIKSIKVRNLFGYHNYDLYLNESISFVFGSAALGKTTVAEIASGKISNLLADKIIINYDKDKNEVVLGYAESAPECADLLSAKDVFIWRDNKEPMLRPMTKKKFDLFKKIIEEIYYEKDPSRKKVFLKNKEIIIKAKRSLNSGWSIPLSYEQLSLSEQQLMILLNRLLTTTKEIIILDGVDCFMHTAWAQQLYEVFEQCMSVNATLKQIIAFPCSPFTTGGYSDNIVYPELIKKSNN